MVILFFTKKNHQRINDNAMRVKFLSLGKSFCEIPPHHGFNLLAVPDKDRIENDLFRIVYDLSPKLILPKNDVKFLPSKF